MSKPFSAVDKLGLDSVLTFGKYEGCTIYELLDHDVTYLAWLYGEAHKPMTEAAKIAIVCTMANQLRAKSKPSNGARKYEQPYFEQDWDDDIPF